MRRRENLLAITALARVAVFSVAGDASQQAAKTDAAVSQGVVRPGGLKRAPVPGDPSQPGAFVLRVKIPLGVTIPPRWHRSTRT